MMSKIKTAKTTVRIRLALLIQTLLRSDGQINQASLVFSRCSLSDLSDPYTPY